MKKALIIGTILIAGGAAASTPYIVGSHVEKEYHNQLAQLLDKSQLPPEMEIKIDRYERGYRTSTAYASMTIDISDVQQDPAPGIPALPEKMTITFKSEIEHGPFISDAPSPMTLARSITTIELNDEFKKLEQFYFKDKPFFTDTAYFHKDGTTSSVMVIPPYHGPAHNNIAQIKWDGMTGNTHSTWDDVRYKIDLAMPLLEVALGGFNISMKGITVDSYNWFSPQKITLGTANMALSELTIGGSPLNPADVFKISNFELDYNVDQNGALVNAAEEIRIARVDVAGESFKDGIIHLELTNLDAATTQALTQKFQALGRNPDTEVIQNMLFAELQTTLPELLKHSPEFHISKAGVVTNDGAIAGRLKLAFQNGDQFNPEMGLFALIPLLDIEVDLSAPVTTVTTLANSMADDQVRAQLAAQEQVMEEEQIERQSQIVAQQMLQMGIQQNFIQQLNEDYTVRLRFKNGELRLNGKPAEELINMMMGATAPTSGA